MWERISDKIANGKIPMEYKGLIKETCSVCGKPRVANDNLTEVKCLDYYCIKYVKERAKNMFAYLNIAGIGPETSELYLRKYKVKSHMDLIPKVLTYKPELYLWEIAKITAIPGYSDTMEKIFGRYNRFEDYFEKAQDIPPILKSFKDKLIKYQAYFKIKPALIGEPVRVMITGHIAGYANKLAYLEECNRFFGHVAKTVMVKSVTADFVLTEFPDSNTEKLQIARKRGIPVITPTEYRVYLLYKLNPSNENLRKIAMELKGRR